MPKVKTSELQAGMKVAVDVKDSRGRMLLPGGATISDAVIRTLKTWGVASVQIAGDEAEGPSGLDPERLAAQTERVRSRLARSNLAHPFVAQMVTECALRISRRPASRG